MASWRKLKHIYALCYGLGLGVRVGPIDTTDTTRTFGTRMVDGPLSTPRRAGTPAGRPAATSWSRVSRKKSESVPPSEDRSGL
eukprot:5830375-Prymnesium_polylepis.1